MTGSGHHFQGNIVWGESGGGMPGSGFHVVNPLLVQDAGGLFRLRAGSPAVDAAQGSYPAVTLDFDVQARGGTFDVGADELSTTGTQRRPLSPADVGPSRFWAGATGKYSGVAPAKASRYRGETGAPSTAKRFASAVPAR